MSRLLQEIGPKEIMSGFTPDLTHRRAPMWPAGENIILHEGAIRPVPQQKLFANSLDGQEVQGISSFSLEEVFSVFWGSLEKLYRWTASGGSEEEGSGYSGSDVSSGTRQATSWSLERWSDNWVVATNGVDQIQVWKGPSTNFTNLGGTPPSRAEILIAKTPHLVALNTDAGENMAEWCAEGEVEDWVPGVGKSAGALKMQGLAGPIRAAIHLSSEIVFYTESAMHMLQYLGNPLYFGERKLLDGPGAVGKQSVISVGGIHYGFGNSCIWSADGASWRNLSSGKVTDFVFEDFNAEYASKVVAEHLRPFHRVVFHYPRAGSTFNNQSISYDYKYGKFDPPFTLERSAADRTPASQFLLSGNRTGYIFDWSELAAPASPTSPGILAVRAGEATLEIGWKMGGWKGFPWKGMAEEDG